MNALAFVSNLAGPQTLIILLIVLVFFGAKRLPELARAFGQSIREFKNYIFGEAYTKDGEPAKEIDSNKRQS